MLLCFKLEKLPFFVYWKVLLAVRRVEAYGRDRFPLRPQKTQSVWECKQSTEFLLVVENWETQVLCLSVSVLSVLLSSSLPCGNEVEWENYMVLGICAQSTDVYWQQISAAGT